MASEEAGELLGTPSAEAGGAFTRLEDDSLWEPGERERSGAFANLEREALRLKDRDGEDGLLALRKSVQQLHVDARDHVLLERDARDDTSSLRAQISELQQAATRTRPHPASSAHV